MCYCIGEILKKIQAVYTVGTSIVMFGSHKGVNNSRRKYEEIYPIIYKAYSKGEDIGSDCSNDLSTILDDNSISFLAVDFSLTISA